MDYQKLPNWEQLPQIDLYLDQVLLYVNQVTCLDKLDQQKALTASMVNNYVKHGYITKPIKKKYQKEQIARLIAISLLKNVFSIQDIAQVLKVLQAQSNSEALYSMFTTYWNDQEISSDLPEIVKTACQTIKDYYKTVNLLPTFKNGIEGE